VAVKNRTGQTIIHSK